MARIPTGFMELRVLMVKKSSISFQCMKCGQKTTSVYEHSAVGRGMYHEFQAEDTKLQVQEQTKEKIAKFLEKRDKKIEEKINQKHKYKILGKKICCPLCGEAQPWSMIPPLKRGLVILYDAMLTVTLLLLFFSIISVFSPYVDIRIKFGLLAATVVMGIYPMCVILKKKKIKKMIKSESFVPPVYICGSDFDFTV